MKQKLLNTILPNCLLEDDLSKLSDGFVFKGICDSTLIDEVCSIVKKYGNRKLRLANKIRINKGIIFTKQDIISFGNFIRDNYYGVGVPRLISYNPSKYPNGTIEEIYDIWLNQTKNNQHEKD